MRCPKCNLEFNPRSERCPNCGTSAKLAKPDGDTMTRVRRQIAVVSRTSEPPGEDFTDTSFSPVMKFERQEDAAQEGVEDNPADNFPDYDFTPVDIGQLVTDGSQSAEERQAERHHKEISARIRTLMHNKEDDLLAEYYFDDGISDLERYQLAQSYAALEQRQTVQVVTEDAADAVGKPAEEEMSEAAKRLNTFPEESGMDKVLTKMGETYDAAALKVKGFFHRMMFVKCKRVYDRFDQKTAPFLDKLLDRYYYVKFKGLKRKQEDLPQEKRQARKLIWGCCSVLLVLLICAGIFVASLFSAGITGQWIVSYDTAGRPNVIMEFTPGGKAVVSVKAEDGWHVHRQGTYQTRRKNGHDLLTITYEDGSISRLYYVIDGREGTFTNVDTNVEVVYDLK